MAVSLVALLASSFVITAVVFLLFIVLVSKKRSNGRMLPPSPPSRLPVVGHLRLLGSLPHRSLRSLAASYGPVIYLRLGRVPTVVACSASAAGEAMKTRDQAFLGRPRMLMVDRFFYGTGGIGFAPYGEFWRQARRVCVTHMLNPRRAVSFRRLRGKEVGALVDRVRCSAGDVVNLSDDLIIFSNTVIFGVLFGDTDYRMDDDEGGARLAKIFAEIQELLGTVPIGDTVPWLWWVDVVTGLERRTRHAFVEVDLLLERVIADRRRQQGGHDDAGDFVDVLLDADDLDMGGIKAIILDMLGAATNTTVTLLEWAMAELMNNPQEMRKLQDEIRAAVGAGSDVTEDHLPSLRYLKAVVKETLRLHPPSPILLPRETLQDTQLLGYHVPAGTQVLINAWAIGRDPATWGDRAEEFLPQRFLEYRHEMGQDFAYLPFGAGRMGCPGVRFAIPSNELALASLVYHFDWELADEKQKRVDMSELHGLSVRLKTPLLLVANRGVE